MIMNIRSTPPVKRRVLCVEDELTMAKMFKELLEKEGYEDDDAKLLYNIF